MGSASVLLGETKPGKPVYIDPKTRTTHMHIIGSTGEGKSKFMEHLIREDIIASNGLCLIDPHGSLYREMVKWCETKRMLDRANPKRIILFDPSEEGWTFGFNPLKVNTPDLSFHVDAMVKAVAKVWGGENSDKTPLLKRCLRILFHALVEKKLTLLEAGELLNAADGTVRKYLTQNIQDAYVREDWQYLNTLKPKPFRDEFGSSINRMMEFLSSTLVRNIIGQDERTIDFRKIMDEGYILLVNLAAASKISEDNARLLGTLMVNDLFMQAKGRPEGSRPFYLYIDECSLFVNEDIGRILAEGRKFGLHLILAHQHLEQLKKVSEDVYHSVMTNAKTKVVFGGLNADDARVLAEQVFLGELELEEAKGSLSKPVVVRYIKTYLENYSQGKSTSRGENRSTSTGESRSTSASTGTSRGDSESRTEADDSDYGTNTAGNSHGTTSSYSGSEGTNWSETKGSSWSETESESHGRAETYLPELEERPSQVFSLEEQIYRAMAVMVNQPARHAIIKLPKKHTQNIVTPYIEEGYANSERVARFKKKCYQLSEYANPIAQVEKQIAERQRKLLEKAKGPQSSQEAPDDDNESFRE